MAFTAAFESFREDLDEHNDRREQLIKTSRDVTSLSKKIIFLLHRLAMEELNADSTSFAKATKTGKQKLQEVQRVLAGISQEVQGDQYWRYQKQISHGMQEYIEALSLCHFLEFGTLISYGEVQRTLLDSDGVPFFPLATSDYLLGISDLMGELMRFAISGLNRRGGRERALKICAFVRNCRADIEQMTPHVLDLHKKQEVTLQSLQKIEDAAYAIVVRGSEFDLSPEQIDNLVAQSISRVNKSPGRIGDDDAVQGTNDM